MTTLLGLASGSAEALAARGSADRRHTWSALALLASARGTLVQHASDADRGCAAVTHRRRGVPARECESYRALRRRWPSCRCAVRGEHGWRGVRIARHGISAAASNRDAGLCGCARRRGRADDRSSLSSPTHGHTHRRAVFAGAGSHGVGSTGRLVRACRLTIVVRRAIGPHAANEQRHRAE